MNALFKKTKITCTVGPTSDDKLTLKKLINSGMNVMRLNASHGDVEEHQGRIDKVMELRKELDFPITIMLDTKGPEIRCHNFENNRIHIPNGKILEIVSNKEILGNEDKFSITYKDLPNTVKVGDYIMFNDGKLTTKVVQILKNGVKIEAQNENWLSNKKSVNIPGATLKLPFVSEHDKKFIEWGIGAGIDYIAASFVNSKKDIQEIRAILKKHKSKDILIASKVESRISIDNLDEIIEYSDAIMIARGDLGVEVPYYDVPELQRIITEKTRAAGKVVITATQMLDSMTENPMPTRAEVTDVYYAVSSGTDSTMLSGETANGLYPVRTVEVMAQIAKTAEISFNYINAYRSAAGFVKTSNAETALEVAKQCNYGVANYVIVITSQGRLISALSAFRPNAFLLGVTDNKNILYKYGPSYGVYMNLVKKLENFFDNEKEAMKIAKKWGAVTGDNLIIASPKKIKTIKIV